MKSKLIKALISVQDGADIYSRLLAEQIREIEKQQPEYINICKPQAYTGDGSDQMPYFGAIATKSGRDFIDSLNKFDIELSAQAQSDYCSEHGYPLFAAKDGSCYHCKQNIYAQNKGKVFSTGYSLLYASLNHVIYCPHCNKSCCD